MWQKQPTDGSAHASVTPTQVLLGRLQAKSLTRPALGDERPGRILAIDYGRKRIGLAVSDETGLLARPLATLVRSNRRNDLHRLKETCSKNAIGLIVVGLPLHISGEASEMAEEAARFGARLEKELRVRVVMLDERLTSWEAGRIDAESGTKRRKKREDLHGLAAAVLLRDYLSLKRGEAPQPAMTEE
jgi:putative Holliday junction resolvase